MTAYAFRTAGGHGTFTPDGRVEMTPEQLAQHNAALEAAELAEWRAAPDRFAAYITSKGVTTWRGVVIGTIVSRSRYRNNLGATIECVTVRGNNGATYHGRYGCDWSQLVRLRKTR